MCGTNGMWKRKKKGNWKDASKCSRIEINISLAKEEKENFEVTSFFALLNFLCAQFACTVSQSD